MMFVSVSPSPVNQAHSRAGRSARGETGPLARRKIGAAAASRDNGAVSLTFIKWSNLSGFTSLAETPPRSNEAFWLPGNFNQVRSDRDSGLKGCVSLLIKGHALLLSAEKLTPVLKGFT